MPTYEYRCNACGREFEYQQRMADDDLVTCEVCKEPKLEKLISRTAFQLKGGGWYKDLYASSKPDAGGASKDASSTPAASADKPAASTTSDSGSSSSASSGGDSGSSSSSSTPAAAPAATPSKPSSTP